MTARLPLLWVLCAVIVFFAGPTDSPVAGIGADLEADVYFVQTGWHWALPIAAVFGLFAAFYWVVPAVSRWRFDARLGGAHLALMFLGAVLVGLPQRVWSLRGLPSDADMPREYAIWNVVSSAGYIAAGLGLLVFLVVLIDMFFRRRVVRP